MRTLPTLRTLTLSAAMTLMGCAQGNDMPPPSNSIYIRAATYLAVDMDANGTTDCIWKPHDGRNNDIGRYVARSLPDSLQHRCGEGPLHVVDDTVVTRMTESLAAYEHLHALENAIRGR